MSVKYVAMRVSLNGSVGSSGKGHRGHLARHWLLHLPDADATVRRHISVNYGPARSNARTTNPALLDAGGGRPFLSVGPVAEADVRSVRYARPAAVVPRSVAAGLRPPLCPLRAF